MSHTSNPINNATRQPNAYELFLQKHDQDGSGTISLEEMASQEAQNDYAQLSVEFQKRALGEMFPDTARSIFTFQTEKLGYTVWGQTESAEANQKVDDHELIIDPKKFGKLAIDPIAIQVFNRTHQQTKDLAFSARGLNLMQAAIAKVEGYIVASLATQQEPQDFAGALKEARIALPVKNITTTQGLARTNYYGDQPITITQFEDAEGETWFTLASAKSIAEDLGFQSPKEVAANITKPVVSKRPIFGAKFQRVRSAENDAATAHFLQERVYDFMLETAGIEGTVLSQGGPFQGVIRYGTDSDGEGGATPYGAGYFYGDGLYQPKQSSDPIDAISQSVQNLFKTTSKKVASQDQTLEQSRQNGYSGTKAEIAGWTAAYGLIEASLPQRPESYQPAPESMEFGLMVAIGPIFEQWLALKRGVPETTKPWTYGDNAFTPDNEGDDYLDVSRPADYGHIDHVRDIEGTGSFQQAGIWMKFVYALIEGVDGQPGLRQLMGHERAIAATMKFLRACVEGYVTTFGDTFWSKEQKDFGRLTWQIGSRFFGRTPQAHALNIALRSVGLLGE